MNLFAYFRFSLKSLALVISKTKETADPITLFCRRILQFHNTVSDLELLEIIKPNLIKIFDLYKNEAYQNNYQYFRIFLLAVRFIFSPTIYQTFILFTKYLSDINAFKIFNAFYANGIFTKISEFYISWIKRCSSNHNFVRSILIKAGRMNAEPKLVIDIARRLEC
ncbi:unnamed protein product [Thelazia callipaeda]|uniref:Uncharacterized protein n=1 Tax=Thelazia callipaeda TaxID=103827 RepID=A0A3P7MQL4_THECL|nr:unnamed protein product [Thelazia callipaeda]